LSSSVTALTRQAGENVGSYNILTSTLSAPSSNYNAPALTGSPALTITPATVTGAFTNNQTEVYGAGDPALSGIGITLTGLITIQRFTPGMECSNQ